ncbi:mannose-1-phosphate guanylyltransferase [Pedobacter sp. SYP-B3415]|uniref:mannose-1-phosphate guanylyltransferase n=1 Tax=Pedobacter sp. SYP-B3415 TaxID=2496641 RepID=UPI00101C7C0F|nr:mannose-1-phosphate guanylyltransferase [Pedobacter sp. SYP-B3415]
MKNTYVLIMAGGVGSRFWPKSRNNFPKQFIDILGIGKSLLQLTFERFEQLCPADHIFVVTNEQYRDIIQEQLPCISGGQIICEPSRNNTAPCIAYAVFKLSALDPDANIVVAPSDHFILYPEIFLDKVRRALEFTSHNDALVTLGINPTRPDTGYGYIKYQPDQDNELFKVEEFKEKPNLEAAKGFLQEGNYLWNAGIFIWHASALLSALQRHAPELFEMFESGTEIYNTGQEAGFIAENYPKSPNISIDYAIMERADNVYTIPAEFGWSDLGTWGSLFETSQRDSDNNALCGSRVHVSETRDSIIHIQPNKLAVIKGLDGFIVVDEGNALLIYPKGSEQEIKTVVSGLQNNYGSEFS